MPAESGLDRMRCRHLAKPGRERLLALGGQRLAGEEQHQVFEPRGPDLGDQVVVEVARDVDAVHFGAD